MTVKNGNEGLFREMQGCSGIFALTSGDDSRSQFSADFLRFPAIKRELRFADFGFFGLRKNFHLVF